MSAVQKWLISVPFQAPALNTKATGGKAWPVGIEANSTVIPQACSHKSPLW